MDPFDQLSQAKITEEKRFDMAFSLYNTLLTKTVGPLDNIDVTTGDLFADTAFDLTDTFIKSYREGNAK